MRRTLPASLLLLACAGGCSPKVPEHLQVAPRPIEGPAAATPTDLRGAVAAMIGRDPLARSPKLLPGDTLEGMSGAEPLVAYAETVRQLERGDGHVERALQQLEDEWRGTVAVPLGRGYRLRIVENTLANAADELDDAAEQQIVTLITPLQAAELDETLPLRPLEWLTEGGRRSEAVRRYADRWVLTAWMEGPALERRPAVEALSAPMYDGLVQTAMGRLLVNRERGEVHPHDDALADLRRGTYLALSHAAADRDREQSAWSDLESQVAAELGADDPESYLLGRALPHFIESAADDRAAGAALLTLAARRWHGECEHPPCTGVDRTDTMGMAGRWHREIAPLAATWQVIAVKEAVDTMEVGHDSVLFAKANVDLVDALLGTGAGPFDLRMLRRRSPDPSVWLALGRSVGTEGVTDWAGTRVALGGHLERLCAQAVEQLREAPEPDAELLALVERIASRAVP